MPGNNRRTHKKTVFREIFTNILLLIVFNTAVITTVYIVSLVSQYRDDIESIREAEYQIDSEQGKEDMHADLIRGVVLHLGVALCAIGLSAFLLSLNTREIKKNLLIFQNFFKTGFIPGNRIDTEALNIKEAVQIADAANEMMSLWERETKRFDDSEARYRDIVQNVTTGILEFNREGDVLFCNRYAEKIFGYSAEELIGKRTLGKLNPEEDSTGLKHWDLLTKIFAHPEHYAYNENENRTKDGRRIWVAWRNHIITDSEGKKKSILCLANDITEQKKNRELLKKSLEEKKVLLKEIHHRIKNNLQIIASILNLQKTYPDIDREILTECENRVVAMSIVHEQLFESENLSTIDASWYIRSLSEHVIETYTGGRHGFKTMIDADPVELDIDTAVPLGLIVNELLTNSMKHGFTDPGEGKITISVKNRNGEVLLGVKDNGGGLRKGFSLENVSSLGLTLVRSLVSQLNGTIDYTGTSGTEWNIRFPYSP